uniref:Ovule protein n=1 Tax=Rodentolepis nana TaxID=102285 RepID=A0A0R3TYL7_RODNA
LLPWGWRVRYSPQPLPEIAYQTTISPHYRVLKGEKCKPPPPPPQPPFHPLHLRLITISTIPLISVCLICFRCVQRQLIHLRGSIKHIV